MLDNELDREINTLLNRHWVDQEILKCLEDVEKTLNENYKVLKYLTKWITISSYEKFKQQLSTGILKWGPVHNDVFWSEHFIQCEEDDFAAINKLIILMNTGNESTTAIACYDLGQFARFHPYGRLYSTL